jgi:TonB family protein
MSTITAHASDVFSAREIARAAGVARGDVEASIRSGALRTLDGRFVAQDQAVRAVQEFRRGLVPSVPRQIFSPPATAHTSPGRALAASGALHGLMFAGILVITTLGVTTASQEVPPERTRMRMVFLATPGPGGGGGGGGLRQPAPPKRAELKGPSALRSPVPPPRPPAVKRPEARRTPPVRPRPVERPIEPPPVATAPEPLPQVIAPVATAAADPRDQAGVLAEAPAATASQGSGTGGGAGTGQGTGLGEGEGSGIGPGSGGGTGGGPYRAGSGISAPAILREVKPDYTEDARRRGIEGDVVLEIVVRRDGSVGAVTMLHGLGAGLDQRAIDAVRQWRFSPARRQGTPVDVMVEVAVEFKLR